MSDVATCLVCGCSRNMPYEQHLEDLVAELRRQLEAMVRQNDRLRSRSDEVKS